MSLHYRTVTYGSEPTSPELGEIWIEQVASSYQSYIWLDSWVEWVDGGNNITETDADTHYVNVVIQEAAPDSIIRPGWIWIKESTLTASLYIWDYLEIAVG